MPFADHQLRRVPVWFRRPPRRPDVTPDAGVHDVSGAGMLSGQGDRQASGTLGRTHGAYPPKRIRDDGRAGAVAATGDGGRRHGRSTARGRTTAGPARRRGEFRGMWLATVANRDWPSRPGLTAAAAARRTARPPRHRRRAPAEHGRSSRSGRPPTRCGRRRTSPGRSASPACRARHPGWDPLGTAVREAHARGLELHAWFNPYRVANHTDPSRLVPTHPARGASRLGACRTAGSCTTTPGMPEVRRVRPGRDARRRTPLRHRRRPLRRLLLPVSGRRPGLRRRRDVRTVRRRASPTRPPGGATTSTGWSARCPTGSRRSRPGVALRHQPLRGLAQRRHRPAGLGHPGGRADLRRSARRHPQAGSSEGWIDYIVPQLYWNIGFAAADYAKLLPWWDEVVRGTGVDSVHRRGALQGGRPRPARRLAGPGRAVPPPHAGAAVRRRSAGHCFFSAKEVGADPDRRDGQGRGRPLSDQGGAAGLNVGGLVRR